MKVEDVINRVRTSAGDMSALQFTNDQVLAWINDGIRECAVDNNLLQKRGSQNSVVGQGDYALPSDILKLHSIKYDNEKLRFLTLEEFDQYYSGVGTSTTDVGTPQVAYVWAGVLKLFPVPQDVKQIIIDYLYDAPVHLIANIATDEVGLPVGYHSRIVDYCLAQVAQQDDDIERYLAKMQEFKTGVQQLKDQPESTYDLYPSISVSERDSGIGTDLYLW